MTSKRYGHAEIAEALQRCEAATPGPWIYDTIRGALMLISAEDGTLLHSTGTTGEDDEIAMGPADFAFCAAARTGWPRALAELQALARQVIDDIDNVEREIYQPRGEAIAEWSALANTRRWARRLLGEEG